MLATTRGAILRGTTEDVFGEDIDDNGGTVQAWVAGRRNLNPNPVPTTTAFYNFSTFTAAPRTDFPSDIVACLRFTRTATTSGRIAAIVGVDMPRSVKVAVRLRVRASHAMSGVMVNLRPDVTGSANQVTIATIAIPVGVSEIMVAGTSFSAATTANSGVALIFASDAAGVGQTVDITAWDIEESDAFGDFFYGDTPDTAERRYLWAGAVAASASIEEILTETIVDGAVAGLEDFPCSITEHARSVFDPAEGTYRTVRELVGRIPGNILVQDGDRLRDNRTGEIFIIDEDERTPRSISGRASVTLSLRRTGG